MRCFTLLQSNLIKNSFAKYLSITRIQKSRYTYDNVIQWNLLFDFLLFSDGLQGRIANSVENSPIHGRKMNRAGSVSTLSSCDSLASDDLMMDYERSDASSFGDVNSRYVLHAKLYIVYSCRTYRCE